MTKKLLIATYVLLAPIAGLAQKGLSLVLENYTVQNQQGNVSYGYTITINSTLINNDSINTFAGEVDFGLRNAAGVINASSIFGKPTYSGDTIILQPGESVPAIFSVEILPQFFGPGPDVVVVWPICTSPVNDSVVISLIVNDPSSLPQPKAAGLKYFIDNDALVLLNLDKTDNIKQVRIFNASGQLYNPLFEPQSNRIDLQQLPGGVYIAQIEVSTSLYYIRFVR